MHLPTKFNHPMFNRSEVIVLTNKQTNPQTNKKTLLKTSTSLCYVTLVEKLLWKKDFTKQNKVKTQTNAKQLI